VNASPFVIAGPLMSSDVMMRVALRWYLKYRKLSKYIARHPGLIKYINALQSTNY
jgi:hypothetical protein